jgi:CubicO group peptidase (beta-lactamase class C family)
MASAVNGRVFLLSLTLFCGGATAQTGTAVLELAVLDSAIQSLMEQYGLPGASLAVARNGRLVLARGYGLADRDLKIPVQPDSIFRTASVSKPITSAAVLKLAQDGKLSLDGPLVPLLGGDRASIMDSRWNEITVRQVLQDSGGWDAQMTVDPLSDAQALTAMGLAVPITAPVSFDAVLHTMESHPLQFTPGSRFSYSNFGYELLTRLIEQVAGMGYEEYVRQTIFEPLGIQRAAMAGSLRSARVLGEVEYYDYPGAPLIPALFPGIGATVAAPDGGWYVEGLQGAGSWAMSTVDLVRFGATLDVTSEHPILQPQMRQQIGVPPRYADGNSQFYGLGWYIQPPGAKSTWLHNGAIAGNYTVLYRVDQLGVAMAVAFNSLPAEESFGDAVDALLLGALENVVVWPEADQFPSFYSGSRPRLAMAGAVQGASWVPGAIAAGGAVTLFGENLTSQVLFDGQSVDVISALRNRVDLRAPSWLAGHGTVQIEVVNRRQRSAALNVRVQDAAPGLYSVSGNGRGALQAQNEDGTTNDQVVRAAPESVVTLWGTGMADPAVLPIDVRINGQSAEVIYAGPTQVNVRIPRQTAPGRAMVEIRQGDWSGRPDGWIWIH